MGAPHFFAVAGRVGVWTMHSTALRHPKVVRAALLSRSRSDGRLWGAVEAAKKGGGLGREAV